MTNHITLLHRLHRDLTHPQHIRRHPLRQPSFQHRFPPAALHHHTVFRFKIRYLIQNHLRQQRLRPDRIAVIKTPPMQTVWIPTKRSTLTQSRPCLLHDAQQHGNVLITVQPIRNEKRHHYDIRRLRQLHPIRHQRLLLHVCIHHLRKPMSTLANQCNLILDRLCAVLIQARSMPYNHQTRLLRLHPIHDLRRTLQQQPLHVGVNPHRIAVINRLVSTLCDRPIQPQLPR